MGITAGALLAVCGIALWASGGGWMLSILGAVVIVSVLLEPVYGRATNRPLGGAWRPTDEKFVDPESGKLLTVWFDPRPATGATSRTLPPTAAEQSCLTPSSGRVASRN